MRSMSKIQLVHTYEYIISLENLLEAWKEFIKGKRKKKDVQEFQQRLMDNIFELHRDLSHHIYHHGSYQAFAINDPKPRSIHKATVRDRLEALIPEIREFLQERLRLTLHPQKLSIATLASGVDSLGWAHFSDHRVLRTTTKRRMLKRLGNSQKPETLWSYLGLLKHGNTQKIVDSLTVLSTLPASMPQ